MTRGSVIYVIDRLGRPRPVDIIPLRKMPLAGPWLRDAACAGLDPALFFPERDGPDVADAAKAVCVACPVQPECLDWALTNNMNDGVWGGACAKERRQLKRRARRGVVA